MRTWPALIVMVLAAAAPAFAQNPLDEAKRHYAAAAYEDALASLDRAAGDSSARRVEVEQYRAFCLIALGKMPDAERAVAALVDADPQYKPSPSVASPTVLSLVADMRKKELPGVARRLLEAGRAAFKEKDYEKAQQQLEILLELLEEPAASDLPGSGDLRLLAESFVTLADASARENGPNAEAMPASASAPAAAAPPPVPDVLTEPVPLQQAVPQWIPPNPTAAARAYDGAIRVLIGVDGRVKSATMERPTYPSYDVRLLQASREWLYKPATRNGEPVESERVIPIQLRPRS